MAKDIANMFKDVRIFIDESELKEREKIILSKFKERHNKDRDNTIKILLLRGYFFDVVLAFFKKIFNLKQNKRWTQLLEKLWEDLDNEIINEILPKLNFKRAKKIRLQDKSIVLQIEKNEGLNFRDYIEFFGFYRNSVLFNQYNISQENIKGKIVIDGGSNLGEFAIYCARLGAKKVYAFEPVTGTYDILVKNIKLNKLESKIIPIKKALGDKNEKVNISFIQAGDGSANIDLNKLATNSEIIEVAKLDDTIKKIEKIGFIKLDIEGYEENALRGASKIIKRDKPILAFSAYHKNTDKTRLPAVVKSIRPDYKIKLLKIGEDDFYCE